MESILSINRDVTDSQRLGKVWDETKDIFRSRSLNTEDCWDSVDWALLHQRVKTLRSRIYAKTKKAEISKLPTDWEKVRLLQKRMIGSYDNPLLSVRQVTQVNQGKSGPEIRYALVQLIYRRVNIYQWSPQPVNRIHKKLRPLGIDRVIQAIVKNALEPENEYFADINSYGFRPGRSAHDAIEKIYITLSAKDHKLPRKRWILGGDIQGCFDRSYLLGVLGDFPATPLIERWLNLEKNLFYGTDTGVLPKKCKEGQKKMQRRASGQYWFGGGLPTHNPFAS